MQIKPRGQYHHGQLAQSLISAGMQTIADSGADALSLRKLAMSIGVSATAAYKHFDSKAALANAIRLGIKAEFDATIEAAYQAHEDAGTRMFAMGKAYLTFARENPLWFDFLFSAPVEQDGLVPDSSESLFFRATQEMSSRKMTEEDLMTAAMQGWALVHGLATLERQQFIGSVCPQLDDQLLRAIFERTLRGWV
ncbi:TetR/AcrR family transcriptional regulator [Salinibius halmophilus]|uniref:TetR/AcrR family transcriptional regulator n=1 Tax=Salinibius halmophilus TaxID=1853216 RepID=UPI000E66BC72|nr:TetR/AcrR family transcriptional regulator [Salinibius halmophilus]